LCLLNLNLQLYFGFFEMLIELGYQLYIHACSGNYLENIFLLVLLFVFFFQIFCVKRPDGKVRLICPDVHSSCPDERVCAISYVALRSDVT
jgi:hypothetical protein